MKKHELLKKLSAASFAAVETHLFLDTHPCDREALALNKKYVKETEILCEEYERLFGPLKPQDVFGDTSFEWVNGPWPWDRCFEECDG